MKEHPPGLCRAFLTLAWIDRWMDREVALTDWQEMNVAALMIEPSADLAENLATLPRHPED